ncbi:hypothetical protein [Piscinibacter koreensis]|uniref:Mor transcription activator domain-containing protein n=1 Tax=Piscinibacter koreensis TaxID=2742824 RepID=A0A7Y6TX68_9BURK|nr:hypothetical protein [Schlegelella koreensis]NUZ06726.1 hypothetical protein [Schlegelella koreensis]
MTTTLQPLPHLVAIAQRALQQAGMAEGRAAQLADKVVEAFRQEFNGHHLYIPSSRQRVTKAERALEATLLKDQGLTVDQIRLRMRCSRHYVQCLLSIERKRLAAEAASSGGARPITPRN